MICILHGGSVPYLLTYCDCLHAIFGLFILLFLRFDWPIPLPALPAWFACFGQTTTQPGLKPGRPGSQATIFCLTGSAGLLGNQIPGVPRSGLAEHTSQGSKFLEVKHIIIKVNFDKYSALESDQQANILVSLPAWLMWFESQCEHLVLALIVVNSCKFTCNYNQWPLLPSLPAWAGCLQAHP